MSTTYQAYLASPAWKLVADTVKQRAGYKCQVCNSETDLQAHHRTYEHRGREMEHLGDLICMCKRCHSIFHCRECVEPVFRPTPPPRRPMLAPAPVYLAPCHPYKAGTMVLVTKANAGKLIARKPLYHWMRENGIGPTRSGWRKRLIGHSIPAEWFVKKPWLPAPV